MQESETKMFRCASPGTKESNMNLCERHEFVPCEIESDTKSEALHSLRERQANVAECPQKEMAKTTKCKHFCS